MFYKKMFYNTTKKTSKYKKLFFSGNISYLFIEADIKSNFGSIRDLVGPVIFETLNWLIFLGKYKKFFCRWKLGVPKCGALDHCIIDYSVYTGTGQGQNWKLGNTSNTFKA